MINLRSAISVGILLAGAGAAIAGASRSGKAQDVTTTPALNFFPGITIDAVSVAEGAQPALPDGSLGVTRDEAISSALPFSVARDQNGDLKPGVQISAVYGLVTNTFTRPLSPEGEAAPLIYDHRPAWVVTFSGPGIVLTSQGPVGSLVSVHNVMSIVIDAATGKYLFGYS